MFSTLDPTAATAGPSAEEFRVPAGLCQVCLRGPAAPLKVVQQTGMILARRSRTADVVLCQSCGTALFRQAQSHNLAFGWWGPISFVTNFYTLGANFFRARKHRGIGSSVGAPLVVPMNPGKPVWKRAHMLVPVAFVALAIVMGISSIGAPHHERPRYLTAGECINIPATASFTDVEAVPCTDPHDGEVAGTITSGESSAVDLEEACARLAVPMVLPNKLDDVTLSTLVPQEPGTSPIRAVCVLEDLNQAKMIGRVTTA